MGRPTVLTPAVAERIVELVRAGNFRRTAMLACGVSKNTVRNWELRGEAGEEPYATFAADLQEAEALSEVDMVAVIKSRDTVSEAGHLLSLLERRFVNRWCVRVNQHKLEAEDAILAKLRAHPKLHAEVAHVLAAEEDSAPGTAPSH